MTPDPVTPRSTGIPVPALIAAPIAVAAMAYVGDIVFGGDPWVLMYGEGTGVQVYALITALFCALEGLVVVPIYLRKGRSTHAAALMAYLAVVAGIVFWLGSFQTN